MGRRSIYTTLNKKRKARAKRKNEQLKLNEQKHESKNKKDRECQQKNRERANARRKADSSSHLAEIAELSKQLDNKEDGEEEDGEEEDSDEQSVEHDETMEASLVPDEENISDSDIYGDQGGFGDDFQGSSPDI
jgi:hypothetical protein